MYIVLEGIDTAGKSTQIELLHQAYPSALITKEPGGTAFGEKIRSIILHQERLDAMTELLLFLSDRREHFAKQLRPALEAKRWVISDRSLISGISYALVNESFTIQKLIDLNMMVLDGTLPDGVILFDLPEETLVERLSRKSHDGIEKRGIDYLLKVQEALKETTKLLGVKHTLVDASQDIETIHEQIKQFIAELKGEQ